MIYDHILTLPEEIRAIWLTRRTLASAIFLLNRYFSLVGYIVVTYYDGIYSDLTNVSQMFYYRIISFRNLYSADDHPFISCTSLLVYMSHPGFTWSIEGTMSSVKDFRSLFRC